MATLRIRVGPKIPQLSAGTDRNTDSRRHTDSRIRPARRLPEEDRSGRYCRGGAPDPSANDHSQENPLGQGTFRRSTDRRQRWSNAPGPFQPDRQRPRSVTGLGKLSIRFSKQQGHIHLLVADNGPGIAAEHQARIFERFFTTKGEAGGNGMGLALSKRIVEEHNGKLSFRTAVREGRSGTAFKICFPA